MIVGFSLILLALLVAANVVTSTPVRRRSPFAVKDAHFIPNKWSRVGPAPENHQIQLSIALKQSRFDELERHLYEGK